LATRPFRTGIHDRRAPTAPDRVPAQLTALVITTMTTLSVSTLTPTVLQSNPTKSLFARKSDNPAQQAKATQTIHPPQINRNPAPQMPHWPPPDLLALAWRNDAIPRIVAFRSAETYVQRSSTNRRAEGSPPGRLYLCSLQSDSSRWAHAAPLAFAQTPRWTPPNHLAHLHRGHATTRARLAARRTAYCPRCRHCTRPLICFPETHE
jgi:hypothetical protein